MKKRDIELSYLAGTIDGEGTIGIFKDRYNYRILLQIVNTSKALMTWLKTNFGGNIDGPYKGKKENWKDRFVWRYHGHDAIRMIKMINQYLVVKNKQAELAIGAWDDTFKNNYRGKKISISIIDRRECYRKQMNRLNIKGTIMDMENAHTALEIGV